MITRKNVAEKLGAYLRHEFPLSDLVIWAEDALQDGEIEDEGFTDIRDVLAQLGLADVRAFGLMWEDCESFLHRLGYSTRVEIQAV